MGITISNSQGLWLGFSLWKHSSTSVDNVGIYSVVRYRVYQIWQIGKIECFAAILREGLTRKTLAKTNCHHPIMTLRIPVMCWAHASLRKKDTQELPAKTSLSSICLESSHLLSHTTLTMKSYMKYRVHMIEHDYN